MHETHALGVVLGGYAMVSTLGRLKSVLTTAHSNCGGSVLEVGTASLAEQQSS